MRNSHLMGTFLFLSLLGMGSLTAGAQVAPPFTTLYNFTGTADGDNPTTDLYLGRDNVFYGTSTGLDTYGSVFSITPSGLFTTLHTFTGNGDDGAFPEGSVVADHTGNLYGTTSNGGANGMGTVFHLSEPAGFTTLYSFTGRRNDGSAPYGGLIFGKHGLLYGTTSAGGRYGGGTIYSITTAGTPTTLLSFNYRNGAFPIGNLITDPVGTLYGVTNDGGQNGSGVTSLSGTVFAFAPNIAFVPLHEFSTLSGFISGTNWDGAMPYAGLTRDAAGNLYGTTSNGGQYGYGNVFSITTDGVFHVLHDFTDGTDGANPTCNLLLAKDGRLYGTASYGGANQSGTIFQVSRDGSSFNTLYTFSAADAFGVNADGYLPSAGLAVGPDGNLYSTAAAGGAYHSGTIFKLTMTPVIASFAPSSGPTGTNVTLTGVNFTEAASVTVGGHSAVYTINSDGSLSVTIPAGVSSGKFVVKNPFGYGTSLKAFKVTH